MRHLSPLASSGWSGRMENEDVVERVKRYGNAEVRSIDAFVGCQTILTITYGLNRDGHEDREDRERTRMTFAIFASVRVYASLMPAFDSGSWRTRLPVAAKMALLTAGSTGGSAGSPNPVGGLFVTRKCTSISGGAWRMRTG